MMMAMDIYSFFSGTLFIGLWVNKNLCSFKENSILLYMDIPRSFSNFFCI